MPSPDVTRQIHRRDQIYYPECVGAAEYLYHATTGPHFMMPTPSQYTLADDNTAIGSDARAQW